MSTAKSTTKTRPAPLADYAENPPTRAQREQIGELESEYFPNQGKGRKPAADVEHEDDPGAELAAMRDQVANLEAAVARLQELAAGALKGCPCGKQAGTQPRLFIMDGTAFCSSGHFSFYSARSEPGE